jgi:DNA polymerase-3 subunit beta
MLRIRSTVGETHIKGIDADDFPAIPTAGDRPTTRVSQKVLRQALEETAFAAATDEARPILTGVLARFEGATLTLAAADNYRIAVKTIPLLDPVEDTSVVVPARSLTELGRILTETDDPVDIVLAPARNQILFHLEGVDLVSRLIDGQFPNYQTVLPKSHSTRAVVDREDLLKAVKVAALIASSSANIVKLQVGAAGAGGAAADAGADDEAAGTPGVTVTANADVGDNEGRVEAAVEGDGTTIAFNARYLSDVLQNVDAEQFALELNGPLSPGVFRPIGDDQYVHVVMPVRTHS